MDRPDALTRAYIAALYFTDEEEIGGADLAPDTLAQIVADCAAFQAHGAWLDYVIAREPDPHGRTDEQAGHDFWLTRQGHGAGFWDGDWPEPHAAALTALSDRFGPVDSYVGDDGLIYLSR